MVEAELHHDETIAAMDLPDQDDFIFGMKGERPSLGLTNKNSSNNANEAKNNALILDMLKQIV